MTTTELLKARLVGASIRDISFQLDSGGYQHLVIELDNDTVLDCYENRLAGQTALKLDGVRVLCDDGEFA